MKKKSNIGKYKDINKIHSAKEMSDYMEDRVEPITKEFTHRKKDLMDYKNESIRFLEDYLKNQNIYFVREKAFFTNKGDLFYSDFYIPETRIAIELDGGYHETEKRQHLDEVKELLLASRSCATIRFKNEEVFDLPLTCRALFYKKAKNFWITNRQKIENYGFNYGKWERYNDDDRNIEIENLKVKFASDLEKFSLTSEIVEFNKTGDILWTFRDIFECHFKTGIKFKEVLNKFNMKSNNWKTRFKFKSDD